MKIYYKIEQIIYSTKCVELKFFKKRLLSSLSPSKTHGDEKKKKRVLTFTKLDNLTLMVIN